MADVTASAVRFAEEGFEVGWYQGMLLSSQQDTIKRDAETASIFLKDGKPPAPLFGEPATHHHAARPGADAAHHW